MLATDWKSALPDPFIFYGNYFDLSKSHGARKMVNCCFHKDKTPSMSINLETGRFKCFGCGVGGDIIDFYRTKHSVDFKTAKQHLLNEVVRQVDKPVVTAPAVKPDWYKRIWDEAAELSIGDPVDQYLKGRGIKLHFFPDSLRYHPRLLLIGPDKSKSYHPGMLARFENRDGEMVGIHRTYLSPEGKKIAVKCAGSIGAIKLFPAKNELAIAEGIETALSCYALDGLPVWSCYSSSGMELFEPPGTLKTIYICIDVDENKAGEKAGNKLANKLLKAGLEVYIAKPPKPNNFKGFSWDWNDYINSPVESN